MPNPVALRDTDRIPSAVDESPDRAGLWDQRLCRSLIVELNTLRAALLERESALQGALSAIEPSYVASARNLVHYLELRRSDLRPLQERLARLGVSSLGRAESHVLASLNKAIGILHRLAGLDWAGAAQDEPAGINSSRSLLGRHTEALLGAAPAGRRVHIMVTLPAEAAGDYGLIKKLVAAGMDVARINCAHDNAAHWRAMAAQVRRAARAARRPVRILMDLGGPKLRTELLRPGPAVLKLKPKRDDYGRVIEPARLGLRGEASAPPIDGATTQAIADSDWLAGLRVRDVVVLTDARGKRRELIVERRGAEGAMLKCSQTAYLTPKTEVARRGRGRAANACQLSGLPRRPGVVPLACGALLRLVAGDAKADKRRTKSSKRTQTIGCTLPEVFAQVRKGERVWFDDGRIGGVIRAASAAWIEVEITDAREGGEKLAGDKGINLPDSELKLPALTAQDLADLEVAADCADMIGLSFVQSPADIEQLRSRLKRLGASDLGIVLKVETRRAFDNLPSLLLAAMRDRAVGVMIARGDLAVECGYERLAEVQEEILWACEAAHMPVIWATQVLESLAKTGRPSRSEITDAAMSERAECVMLNKGPFIIDAMRTLDDILKRMQALQSKKRQLLRALRSWDLREITDAPAT